VVLSPEFGIDRAALEGRRQGERAGNVGADKVAGDDIVVRAGISNIHIVEKAAAGKVGIISAAVAGNDVALGGIIAAVAVGADDVGLSSLVNPHTCAAAVAQGNGAAGIGADQVTGAPVAIGVAAGDVDAPR